MIEKYNIYSEWVDNWNKRKSTIKNTLCNLLWIFWIKSGEKESNNLYSIKNPRFIPSRNVYQFNNRVISDKEVDDYISSI